MTYRDFLLGSVALVSLVVPGAVLAQDAVDNFSWTGAYVGADVGIGMGSVQRDDIQSTPAVDLGSFGSEQVIAGLFAGYDYEVAPGLVFGIEAGLDFFNAEGSSTEQTISDTYEFRNLGALHAGIRGGVEISPRTLLYGRLAYAGNYVETSDVLTGPDGVKQEFLNGYQAAIGIESEVIDNVTLRVEGTYTAAVDPLVTGSGGFDSYSQTPTHFGAEVGVAYRFGGESRGPRIDLTPTRSWSGGYVGVLAGGVAASTKNGGMEGGVNPGQEGPVSDMAWQYGGYIGVNQQIGDQWVISAEGELAKYDVTFDSIAPADLDFGTSDLKGQASARFGYLVNPDTLIYARAGYGLMRINPEPDNSDPGTESAYVQTLSAGLGAETMVNEHMLLRAEGLYTTAVDEYRFTTNGGQGPLTIKPTSVEARVGAAFMF